MENKRREGGATLSLSHPLAIEDIRAVSTIRRLVNTLGIGLVALVLLVLSFVPCDGLL